MASTVRRFMADDRFEARGVPCWTMWLPLFVPDPMRPAISAVLLSMFLIGPITVAAAAASAPACNGAVAPASPSLRADLQAERARIAKVDADLKARNEAMQVRGATLDLRNSAGVDDYNRDLAALQADAAANDRAWDAYRTRVAQADEARRAAARCGTLATGARVAAKAPTASSPSAASSAR
jgi:hypothetical protein